jgi:hypothetical protein
MTPGLPSVYRKLAMKSPMNLFRNILTNNYFDVVLYKKTLCSAVPTTTWGQLSLLFGFYKAVARQLAGHPARVPNSYIELKLF